MPMNDDTAKPFLQRVQTQYGQQSLQWCVDFPALLGSIAADWELELGPVFPESTHYVRAATHIPTGDPVVLKIGFPAAEFQQELSCYTHPETALRYPTRRIHDADCAVLFDRLLPGTRLDEYTADPLRQIEFLAPLMRVKPANPASFPRIPTLLTVADDVFPHAALVQSSGEQLIATEHLSRVEQMVRSADVTQWCVLHGDIHPGNALLSPSGYHLIDPVGIIAPPAVECSVLLRYHYLGGHGSRAERTRRTAAAIVQFATVSSFAPSDIAQWNYCMMVIAAWWSFQSRGVISERELAAIEDFAAIASECALV